MSVLSILKAKPENLQSLQEENRSTALAASLIPSFSFLANEKSDLQNRVVTTAFFQNFQEFDTSYFDDERIFLLNELIEKSALDLNFLSVNDFLVFELRRALERVHKAIQEFGSENLFRNTHLEKLEKLCLVLTSNCSVQSVDFNSSKYKIDFKKVALMQAKLSSKMFRAEAISQRSVNSSEFGSNSELAITMMKQIFSECHLFSEMLVEMQGIKGVKKIPLYEQKKRALDENLLSLAQMIGLISSFTSSTSGIDFFKTSSLSLSKFPLLRLSSSFSFDERLVAFLDYVEHLKKVAEKYHSSNKAYANKGSLFREIERKLKTLKKEAAIESKIQSLNDLMDYLFETSEELEKELRIHIQKNGLQKSPFEKQEYKEHLSYLSYLLRNLRNLGHTAALDLGFSLTNLKLSHEQHTLIIADKLEDLLGEKFSDDSSDPFINKLNELKSEFFSDFHNSEAQSSLNLFIANIKEDKNLLFLQRSPLKALYTFIDARLSKVKITLSKIEKESFLEVDLLRAEEASTWINSLENLRASLKNYLFFSSEDSNCKSSFFVSDLIREKKESCSLLGLDEEFDDLSIYEEDEYELDLGFEEPDFIDTEVEMEFEPQEECDLLMLTPPLERSISKEEKSLSKFEIKHQKNEWTKQPYRISKRKQLQLEREKSFSGFEKEAEIKNLKIEKQKKQPKESYITSEQAKILLGDDCMKRWKFMSTLSEFGMEKSRSGHGSHEIWGPKNGHLTFPIPLGKEGLLSVGVRRNIVKSLLGEN
jgi:hypothetical protein